MRDWLRRDTRGSTTVEFAVVGWMLCMVTFGIVETGMLWWLKSGMQLTAAMTARCGAFGYTYANANNLANFLCSNTSTTQNYAVNFAIGNLPANYYPSPWLFPNMIVANKVTVNGRVATCNGLAGTFFSVSIVSNFFQFLPPPLGNFSSLTTNACFPMQ